MKAEQMNPFPGLRPFREDEEFLFFGRENQIDAMVDKLAATRFLAVIGGSGSGKSSLVNCGLRPALHGGLMSPAGTTWRMAQFRPGTDPIGEMAHALAADGVLFRDYQAGEGLTLAEIVDTTLRMSRLGLIDIYEQAKLDENVNLLVVVDQFEELFRYRQVGGAEPENGFGVSAEATAFVNLLLEIKEQTKYPIYVVMTMRSDFLGDCTQFTGLAEAINAGQYLVPRMTRDERRAAILGPVGVGGAKIAPVLLTRLVNDVGDNPDQLSILQHALNRTWASWQQTGGRGPLDLSHYEAIGTMSHALDQHAEEAYAELLTARKQQICEKIFKALTDTATDPRGVRRPAAFGTLCAMADATETEVTEVIDVFRHPSRSFLMPPAGKALEADTVVDISHESLMRVWRRLGVWADEEARSAKIYRRLADTAERYAGGKASLLRDPDLQLALDWRKKEKPTAAWADLYQGGFEPAISFLKKSKGERDSEVAEAEFTRRFRKVRNVIMSLVLLSLLYTILSPGKFTEPASIHADQKTALRKEQIVVLPRDAFDDVRKLLPKADQRILQKLWNYTKTRWTEEHSKKDKIKRIIQLEKSEVEKSEEYFETALLNEFYVLKLEPTESSSSDQSDPAGRPENLPPDSTKDGQSNAEPVGSDAGNDSTKESDFNLYVKDEQELKENTKKDLETNGISTLKLKDDRQGGQDTGEVVAFIPAELDVLKSPDKLPPLIKAGLLIPPVKNHLLANPDHAIQIFYASNILGYVLVYFALIFVVGIIYRKFAFPNARDAAYFEARQNLWTKRGDTFLRQAKEFSDRFQSRRWKAALSGVRLIFGAFLLWMGYEWAKTPEYTFVGLLLAITGVVFILLVPPDVIFNRDRALQLKIAQGIALRVVAFFAFSLGCIGFLGLLNYDIGMSGVLAFFFAAIVVSVLGMKRSTLTSAEVLATDRDRAPVLYLRSSEDREQSQPVNWSRLIREFFWPRDEAILRSIFSALGPFISLAPGSRLSPPETALKTGESSDDREQEATRFIRKSALVILQIDAIITDDFLSDLRHCVPILQPEQLLLCFSQQLESEQSGTAYEDFKRATRGIFPCELPSSLGTNSFIEFEEGWRPLVFGVTEKPKFSWRMLIPILSGKLEKRLSVIRALNPFFERRGLVNSQIKLYSDFAIGFAAFPLFFLLPAGYMMFRNLWRTGRRWSTGIGLLAPAVLFVGILIAFLVAIILMNKVVPASLLPGDVADTLVRTMVFLVIFGFPIASYWLWRQLSGREIRRHIAFGGPLQPVWKTILLLVIGLLPVLVLFYLYLIPTTTTTTTTEITPIITPTSDSSELK